MMYHDTRLTILLPVHYLQRDPIGQRFRSNMQAHRANHLDLVAHHALASDAQLATLCRSPVNLFPSTASAPLSALQRHILSTSTHPKPKYILSRPQYDVTRSHYRRIISTIHLPSPMAIKPRPNSSPLPPREPTIRTHGNRLAPTVTHRCGFHTALLVQPKAPHFYRPACRTETLAQQSKSISGVDCACQREIRQCYEVPARSATTLGPD